MNIQRIEENEIPYEELGKFGLTQEMIDDLPEPIMNNLSLLANNMGIDQDHIQELENGEVVTLEKDDQKLSVGIDLNEETGILSVNGDAQAWQKERDGILAFDKYC